MLAPVISGAIGFVLGPWLLRPIRKPLDVAEMAAREKPLGSGEIREHSGGPLVEPNHRIGEHRERTRKEASHELCRGRRKLVVNQPRCTPERSGLCRWVP